MKGGAAVLFVLVLVLPGCLAAPGTRGAVTAEPIQASRWEGYRKDAPPAYVRGYLFRQDARGSLLLQPLTALQDGRARDLDLFGADKYLQDDPTREPLIEISQDGQVREVPADRWTFLSTQIQGRDHEMFNPLAPVPQDHALKPGKDGGQTRPYPSLDYDFNRAQLYYADTGEVVDTGFPHVLGTSGFFKELGFIAVLGLDGTANVKTSGPISIFASKLNHGDVYLVLLHARTLKRVGRAVKLHDCLPLDQSILATHDGSWFVVGDIRANLFAVPLQRLLDGAEMERVPATN